MEHANEPEVLAAEREAARVAAAAAAALKASRQQCQAAPVNMPTWTGRSGAAGGPGGVDGRRLRGSTGEQTEGRKAWQGTWKKGRWGYSYEGGEA